MAGRAAASPGARDPWKIETGEHVLGGEPLSIAVWRFAEPLLTISSAPLGGGLGPRSWVVNAQVPHSYDRRDPDAHLKELAAAQGLDEGGVGMLTAVDVRDVQRAEDGGARADATVGVTLPTWAADRCDGRDGSATAALDPAPHTADAHTGRRVGTINVVAFLPERLSPAALVNAVITVTEAKSQALWEAGIEATGTASDAVCVACPPGGSAHIFGGPRSMWGARLARAVHRAVLDGCRSAPV